ncbi:MAG: tetraacyldisaccharide 4'-kinase [Nitrospirae bacterium CG_4_10_14_0_8_um_filter_41_23]|nr:tetraacyldisaccharide 4'-kinase [Nitrospirota bacterium]OIP59040.1 MAG: tetraacyldisaccharide 4'-kinase [Nitrospirae bacterium CG2_30_41_42]PIQ93294.1 MAG: tetraacyldisaccharide 4'-kinase [Nitrospirae bacterium CG11_big_fil_rev_8_21_14_0_20_41_14]PIV41061.1 MAG: tetraacyldisaccharide 4'-kinase [Nitrospirae bacterium CG02_land_8_20_14_3_00_41_53]PIW87423.1 MAG: tetraacyldisaccharide 4'-kinase [Nitrospirae bacterium CG_4_8_14_3_um_filter_41_47]PIY86425.1 MAG: tetraacyldisaccharide 4'-kinase [
MTTLEFLYYLGYSIKKCHVFKNQKRLPHKVISVGNITVGGTGKTPATIALAKEAKKRGFKPCILTRGYRGTAKGPCFVSRGEEPLLDEYQAGDEALLMAEKLKGIPIVKGKDRYKAGMFALSSLPLALSPDLFILDDGFQHWGLLRDKDILLIDSTNPFGNRRLLPLGLLREPINVIKRADSIVITRTDENRELETEANSLIEEIRQYNTRASIFFAEHKPSKFILITGDSFSLEWAKEKRFFAFCGIGNPQSFRGTLLSADIELIGFKTFRDHYRYSQGDIQEVIRNAKRGSADWIVTTEKDIMRLKGLEVPEDLISLGIEFNVDERFYEEVLGGFDG